MVTSRKEEPPDPAAVELAGGTFLMTSTSGTV